MLKVVAISDTHSKHHMFEIPDADALVHAGDMTRTGKLREVAEFNAWLGTLPHRHKLVIAGNHDFAFEREPGVAQAALTNATYLQDSGVTIDGVRFWGSPWQPRFFDWAFNLDRGPQIREKWELIPPGTDVLITHGPVKGHGDLTFARIQAGCEELADIVTQLRIPFHVCGHIHEGYGISKDETTTYINASCLDLQYSPENHPVVFEVAPRP